MVQSDVSNKRYLSKMLLLSQSGCNALIQKVSSLGKKTFVVGRAALPVKTLSAKAVNYVKLRWRVR